MSIDEPDEEWEEYNFSGFVPMILAGYRMSAARRTFPDLEELAENIVKDVKSEVADLIAWAKAHEHDTFPDHPEVLKSCAMLQLPF